MELPLLGGITKQGQETRESEEAFKSLRRARQVLTEMGEQVPSEEPPGDVSDEPSDAQNARHPQGRDRADRDEGGTDTHLPGRELKLVRLRQLHPSFPPH